MNTPTYKEQFDKITEAYIRGDIRPFHPKFCFCGTLCGGDSSWYGLYKTMHFDYGGYVGLDFVMMESALLAPLDAYLMGGGRETDEYENDLFRGMCAALEVLKQIHISKGEIIDETPKFTKRELLKTI